MSDQVSLTLLIDELQDSSSGQTLTLDDVLSVVGERGFGPLILIISLIALLPTGGVPGVPTACALCVVLLAGQLVAGKHRPWLPARLRRLAIDRHRYKRVAERIKPWTQRIDRLLKPRLVHLTDGWMVRVVGAAVLLIALCMPPLELVPFAAAGPAAALVLIGLGITARDGIWVLFGLVPAVIGGVLTFDVAVHLL